MTHGWNRLAAASIYALVSSRNQTTPVKAVGHSQQMGLVA
jgi:hypothetical protein